LIDLNTASMAELDRLPGISKVLSGRIFSQRPFNTMDDLETVPGIGPRTLDRLRPLVRVVAPQFAGFRGIQAGRNLAIDRMSHPALDFSSQIPIIPRHV
jgi:hypothetical protein